MMKKFFVFLCIIFLCAFCFAQDSSKVVFFYGPGCPHCANESKFLETIEDKYPNLNIVRLNINSEWDYYTELFENYNVDPVVLGKVPILFVGNKYRLGEPIISNNFEKDYLDCVASNDGTCPLITEKETEKEKFSLLVFLGLAGADSVNPCELAVLIILMTAILTRYPKQKNKALKAGVLFSLAIFLMYFIFGILIITGFKVATDALNVAQTPFYILLAAIAIIMGSLNIKDAIWYGGGGFIMEVPQKWRPKMKSVINGTTSPKGAFFVGLIVSFFLTPCTAGPYIIASGYLAKVAWLTALPLLLIYMLIFISPMIVITILAYFGFAKVEDMGGWRERNLKKLHWIAGLLMLGIGIWMILVSFGIL